MFVIKGRYWWRFSYCFIYFHLIGRERTTCWYIVISYFVLSFVAWFYSLQSSFQEKGKKYIHCIVKPTLVTTSIKQLLVSSELNCNFLHTVCIWIKPVFSDNLSYLTIFHCSLGRSHQTCLTIYIAVYPTIQKSQNNLHQHFSGIFVKKPYKTD
jgi:hypothetical protein